SEEKFRNIFNSAQDAIFIINKEDKFIDANEAASRIFGYTKEELVKMEISDLQAPEVRGVPGTIVKSELEKYESKTFEALGIDKFGKIFPVEISQSLFMLKGEEVVLNIVRDISERKKMENKIKDSEMHYRSLFENSPIALWEEDYSLVKKEIDELKKSGIKDIRQYLENNLDFVKKCVPLVKIIDFNQSVLKLYNAKDKKEYLNNLSNVLSESSFNMFKEAMICIAEGKTYLFGEDKNYTIDGKELDVIVTWSVVPGHEKNYDRVYVSDLDITYKKRAEEALRESEEKYRRIVDTANEGIWAMDENYLTTFVNPKMSEMIGYAPEEMIGKRVEYFMFKEDLGDHSDKMKSRTAGISQKYERRFKKKNGQELLTIVSATPLMDHEGNFKGSFGMFTDITERKKSEEIIRSLNDNLKLLNKILRHDISNDLTVVSIALEMIETKDKDMINKAFNAIQRSVDLIEKIRCLESTMSTKYRLKPISTKHILGFVKKSYQDIHINITGECKIMADEALNSVFDNIINNAIIHGKTDRIDIEINSENNICQIKIIDYGVGIPDKIKNKIFEEEFSYGNKGGSGLGLYIVKKTIERYGGTIKVEDTNPHGATFIINLETCVC
ncbi:MAG: PAS domain S-box protein, partial [Candidatus Methanofastidiosa archaeon]|nr:PAS domain S-box protein [Candidatus Methanofastidiosa archaeon]